MSGDPSGRLGPARARSVLAATRASLDASTARGWLSLLDLGTPQRTLHLGRPGLAAGSLAWGRFSGPGLRAFAGLLLRLDLRGLLLRRRDALQALPKRFHQIDDFRRRFLRRLGDFFAGDLRI